MQRDTRNSLLPIGGLSQQTGIIPFHDECCDEGRARAEGAQKRGGHLGLQGSGSFPGRQEPREGERGVDKSEGASGNHNGT